MSQEENISKSANNLSESQITRIEQNRRKAQELRQRKRQFEIINHLSEQNNIPAMKKSSESKLIDTGGGFLLDEFELQEEQKKKATIVERPLPILPPHQPECLECMKNFSGSYLLEKFDYPVCDDCRDPKEKHALITKTEAKKNYLLTDVDLEQRGSSLKYIIGKNPHNSRWSDMKLFLLLQVEQRALEIWESEQKLLEELERREEKRSISKQKSYQKKMKELRMSIRSSLYTKSLTENHVHEYGEESYDEENDIYSRVCKSCDFKETYEKM